MKKEIKQIMNFIKGNPKDNIFYIDGVIDMGTGCKFGTNNKDFAQKFISYFKKLHDNSNL